MFQWSMYYLSFTPLWLSILFKNAMSIAHGTNYPYTERISFVIIPVIFMVSFIIMTKGFEPSKKNAVRYHIERVEEEKLVTMEFLATFIFPLFAFDFSKWEGILLFALFFLIFGFLCVRHNYFCTNIVLEIFGYRTYICKLRNDHGISLKRKIISQRELRALNFGESLYVRKLNNEYMLDCYRKLRR